jgi:hypothetical protein
MSKVGKALTRVELYDAVYRKVGLSRSESSALVEVVLKEISDSVARGETVNSYKHLTFSTGPRRTVDDFMSARQLWEGHFHERRQIKIEVKGKDGRMKPAFKSIRVQSRCLKTLADFRSSRTFMTRRSQCGAIVERTSGPIYPDFALSCAPHTTRATRVLLDIVSDTQRRSSPICWTESALTRRLPVRTSSTASVERLCPIAPLEQRRSFGCLDGYQRLSQLFEVTRSCPPQSNCHCYCQPSSLSKSRYLYPIRHFY